MNVKLPTENHLEFLCVKGGCTGWAESTLVKMPHCWKSHVADNLLHRQPGNVPTVLDNPIVVSKP